MSASPLSIGVVGCGAIGLELLRLLRQESGISVDAIVVKPHRVEECSRLMRDIGLGHRVCTIPPSSLDWLVECGGHSAIAQHVVPALASGVSCVLASVGALASEDLLAEVRAAALRGGAQVQLIPGALGGIDALAAARLHGLEEVSYTGTKSPAAWHGTPAELTTDLASLGSPTVVFDGSARDAARLYPRNANVTATVALAGVGFDATRVRLVADPSTQRNTHRLQAKGRFGEMEIHLSNVPLRTNPKTSALTLYSVLRAVRNHVVTLNI